MAKKITISFKETVKDIALYNAIQALDDKSHDIKQMLYPILIGGSVALVDLNNTIAKSSPTETIDLGVLNI